MRRTIAPIPLILLWMLLLAPGPSAHGADEPALLGEIFFDDSVTGRSAAVREGELLRTTSGAGTVVLTNGHVLRVASNASARFETSAPGQLLMSVVAGRVSLVGPHGEVRHTGSGSRVALRATSESPVEAEQALLRAETRQPVPVRSRADRSRSD